MCASCITGAIYVDGHSNVSLEGNAGFSNNTAKDGGRSLKTTRFYCISGNAKKRFPREGDFGRVSEGRNPNNCNHTHYDTE